MNKSNNILAQAAAQAQISASEQNLDAALASVATSVINSPVVPPAPSQQVQQPMASSLPTQQVQQQMAPSLPQPPSVHPQPAPVQHASDQQRTTAVVMNQSQLLQQQHHQRQNNVHIPVVPNERTEPVIPYSRIISNQNFNSNVQTDKQHNQKQKNERTVSILRLAWPGILSCIYGSWSEQRN